MEYSKIPFSYEKYEVVRRIPREIGYYWSVLLNVSLNNNEGFYCRSYLSGQHSGGGSTGEMEWLVARDGEGNYLICKPKEKVNKKLNKRYS